MTQSAILASSDHPSSPDYVVLKQSVPPPPAARIEAALAACSLAGIA